MVIVLQNALEQLVWNVESRSNTYHNNPKDLINLKDELAQEVTLKISPTRRGFLHINVLLLSLPLSVVFLH